MNRADPFYGYSTLLWILVYGVLPLFALLQSWRVRQAFHVFQLESYKRHWFRRWIREHRGSTWFLRPYRNPKKPLVMTGRAWRTIIVCTVASVGLVLLPAAVAHLTGGAPYDIIVFVSMLVIVSIWMPYLLMATDVVLQPVQAAINARYERRASQRLTTLSPTVVGVTGSYGKTSTKAVIAALIGRPEEVLATPASFNTPLGVIRTINEHLESRHRFLIVEMGARQEGDITELCALARPTVGVLTSIGSAHLESFGSQDAITRGKYEIVAELPADGVAVMNTDDETVRKLADGTEHVPVVRCGLDEAGRPVVTATDVVVESRGTSFTLVDRRTHDSVRVKTKLLGTHALQNLLLGAAVSLEVGRALADLRDPLEELEPVEHRLQLIEGAGGVTVIDDAYNSNPAGAAAAVEVLGSMPGRRKVVVTPGMVELGPMQAQANEEFALQAGSVADTFIVVASVNRDALVRGAREGKADVVVVDSLAEATEALKTLLGPGDIVLFENDLPDQYES